MPPCCVTFVLPFNDSNNKDSYNIYKPIIKLGLIKTIKEA
jgi:hypothetical protein